MISAQIFHQALQTLHAARPTGHNERNGNDNMMTMTMTITSSRILCDHLPSSALACLHSLSPKALRLALAHIDQHLCIFPPPPPLPPSQQNNPITTPQPLLHRSVKLHVFTSHVIISVASAVDCVQFPSLSVNNDVVENENVNMHDANNRFNNNNNNNNNSHNNNHNHNHNEEKTYYNVCLRDVQYNESHDCFSIKSLTDSSHGKQKQKQPHDVNEASCNCKTFMYRRSTDEPYCKHIIIALLSVTFSLGSISKCSTSTEFLTLLHQN